MAVLNRPTITHPTSEIEIRLFNEITLGFRSADSLSLAVSKQHGENF